VVGNSSELLELNKMLKEISEGIQGVIGGVNDQRRMDVKVLGVLQDIQSSMWDFMWKSREESQSFNRDVNLSELCREQELAKKALEMEMEKGKGLDLLFLLDELDQMLR